MYSYFHITQYDEEYFNEKLRPRLPGFIFDAHAHFNLPEHVKNISQEAVAGDWALECGLLMSREDARKYIDAMFPGTDWRFVALPWPLRDADTKANNEYVSELIGKEAVAGLYTVRPEYDTAEIGKAYVQGHFSGFKPYPYMASAVKGADVSIFDFMTREQFDLANRLHATVLMHLPRAGRLPDPDNIAEIRIILNRYPNIKLVLAHFGRCFQPEHLEKALSKLGEDADRLWFDCAAVLNPDVYELAFKKLDSRRILFGTDLPIFLWHGKREWDTKGYHNLCREDFSWNKHTYPTEESKYTFYLYEQLNNILNIIGTDAGMTNNIFHNNAEYVYAGIDTAR